MQPQESSLQALLEQRMKNREALLGVATKDRKGKGSKKGTHTELDTAIIQKIEALTPEAFTHEVKAIQDLNLLWELKNILENLNESQSQPKTLFSRKQIKPGEKEKAAKMARTVDDAIDTLLNKNSLDELIPLRILAELAEKQAAQQGDKEREIKSRKEKEKIEYCIKEKELQAFDAKLENIVSNYRSFPNAKAAKVAIDALISLREAIEKDKNIVYKQDKLGKIEERIKNIQVMEQRTLEKPEITLGDFMLFQQAYILLKTNRAKAKLPQELDDESLKRLPLAAMKSYLDQLSRVKVSAASSILEAIERVPPDKLVAMNEMWQDIIHPAYGVQELRDPRNRAANIRQLTAIEKLKELLNKALSENLSDQKNEEMVAFIDYMQNDCIPKDPEKSDQPQKQGIELRFDIKILNILHYAKRGDFEKLEGAIEKVTPPLSLKMLLSVLEAAFARASDKNLKVIDYLIRKIVNHKEYEKKYDINTPGVSDYTPLQLALIQYENNVDKNETLANQYLKLAFSLVVEQGADLNYPFPDGLRPIDYFALYAKRNDFEKLLDYLQKHKKEVYDQLMAETSIVPGKGTPTLSMLHMAALGGNVETVKVLLRHEAHVNTLAPGGFTPLHFAVLGGHLDVVKLLMEGGAKPNQVGKDYSKQEMRVVTKVHKGALALSTEMVSLERTPLFIAAETGQPEIAAFLLRNKGRFGEAQLHEQGMVRFTQSKVANTPTGMLISRYFVALKRLKQNLPDTLKALSDSTDGLKLKTENIKPQEKTYLIHKLYEHPNRTFQRKILADAEMSFKTRSASPDSNLLDEIERLKGAYLFIKDTLDAERHEYFLGKRHAPSRLEQYVNQQITHLNTLIQEFELNDKKHPELTFTRTDNECRGLFHVFPAGGKYKETMKSLSNVKSKQQSKHRAMNLVYENYENAHYADAAVPPKKAGVPPSKSQEKPSS